MCTVLVTFAFIFTVVFTVVYECTRFSYFDICSIYIYVHSAICIHFYIHTLVYTYSHTYFDMYTYTYAGFGIYSVLVVNRICMRCIYIYTHISFNPLQHTLDLRHVETAEKV